MDSLARLRCAIGSKPAGEGHSPPEGHPPVAAAGGLFIQALPGSNDDDLAVIEANLAVMPPLSQFIAEGQTAEAVLRFVFAGLPVTVHDPQPLEFRCTCSKERVLNALISLGYDEVAAIAQDGQAELICHFCNEKYHITEEELSKLHDEID